jgi:hypothetical protein
MNVERVTEMLYVIRLFFQTEHNICADHNFM